MAYLESVKFEDVIDIIEPDETRNPELPNSFLVNNEFVMVTVLWVAKRKTILETSEDVLDSLAWPDMDSKSASKTD